MADWRFFETRFWNDPYIQELNFEEKGFYIYLFTNPEVNQAGLYMITTKTIMFQTDLSKETVNRLLKKFVEDQKIVYKNNLLWVKSFLNHQASTNPNQKKRILKDLNSADNEKIKEEFVQHNPELMADLAELNQIIILSRRQIVAVRDGFTCQYCKKEIKQGNDLELDHIIPKTKGGKSTYDNLALACFRCNNEKSDKLPQEVDVPFPSVKAYHKNRALKDLSESPQLLSKFNDVFGLDITLKKLKLALNIPLMLGEHQGNIEGKSQGFSEVLDKDKDKDNKKSSNFKQKQEVIFNFNHKKWENIKPEDVNQWREAYPACDIELELKQMREWLLSNPSKKKKNYRRFITNWLSRSQERGGTKRKSNYGKDERPVPAYAD